MKYQALQPIKHDGETVEPGDSIDLSDKAAKPLLDAGVIATPADAKAAAKDGDDAKAKA